MKKWIAGFFAYLVAALMVIGFLLVYGLGAVLSLVGAGFKEMGEAFKSMAEGIYELTQGGWR